MNVFFEQEIRKLCKDLEWEEVVLILLSALASADEREVYDNFKMTVETYKNDKKRKKTESKEQQTSEKKQEQTRDGKTIDAIDFAIKETDSQDDYSMGMRNGMRYVKSLIDGKEPQYELRRTDEEIKLGIDIGDEVIDDDFGVKGVVVGIDTHKGEVLLSLLMRNYKVPQLVKASGYKKTDKHFPQIIEVLEQIKRE